MLAHERRTYLQRSNESWHRGTQSHWRYNQRTHGDNQKNRVAIFLMKLEDVQADIASWIENFLEVRNPALGDRSPCPFARAARLKNSYEVRLGYELYEDLVLLGKQGLGDKEVVIHAYPRDFYTPDEFADTIDKVNQGFLLPVDLIALDDHPDHNESVNGVCFNQGEYALAMVQSLSDLNARSKLMAQQGFYDSWPEEYLEDLFKHREDPRS